MKLIIFGRTLIGAAFFQIATRQNIKGIMKLLFIVGCIFFTLPAFAQKEANIWCFGDSAGVDFNSGLPVVLTNSAMSQHEGCSSISDANGVLLFYTNGISVWNANHTVMPNGSGLLGHFSTSQTLIVKQPGSSTLYYIFTLDYQANPNGFNYSIVDMSLNGGLGDVTNKNVLIYTPSNEKITAVTSANGIDVWIITHDPTTNDFQSYILNAAGFNATPIVSSVGPPLFGNTIGCMKVSAIGNRIAMTYGSQGKIWLFDFNDTTGVVSNPIMLSTTIMHNPYGVEFSPNAQVLYATADYYNLYQWDLSSGVEDTIQASRIDLSPPKQTDSTNIGSLALAPDCKIYFARKFCDYLGVINNPDIAGTGCGLIDSAIYLQGKKSAYGLPNLNQSLYNHCVISNISEYNSEPLFELSPNPAQESLRVIFRNANSAEADYSIMDMLGREIRTGKISYIHTVIDLAAFSNGLYFFRLKTMGGICTKKFLVE